MKSPTFLIIMRATLLALFMGTLLPMGTAVGAGASLASGSYAVTPVLECVVDEGYGSFTAHFGYNNTGGSAASIAVGANNRFTHGGDDRGQPTHFAMGRRYFAFSVSFNGGDLIWNLDGKSAKANAYSRTCNKADISLRKEVDDNTPAVGDVITFTLTLKNEGPGVATEIEAKDKLPNGLAFVSAETHHGTYDPNSGIWKYGSSNAGSWGYLYIKARVTTSGSITNTAEVTNSSLLDPNSGNNKSSVTIRPKQADDLCYVIADDIDPTGGNAGGKPSAFFIVNPITGHETMVGKTGAADIEAAEFDAHNGILYAVDAGQFGTIDLSTGKFTPKPHVFGSGKGSIGVVEFDDVDGLAFDPTSGILYGSVRREPPRYPGEADLLIQIDTQTGKAVANAFGYGVDYVVIQKVNDLPDIDDLAFSLSGQLFGTANNDGNDDRLVKINKATGATYDVGAIRDGYGKQLHNFEGFTSNEAGQLIGLVGGNDKNVYRIDAHTAKATLLSTLAKASDYEAITCNLKRREEADLELLKTVNDDKPYTGGNVIYTVKVVNKGPDTATSVKVRDKLPYGLLYAQHDASQGTYDPSTGLWKIGTLADYQSVTLKIVARVEHGDPIVNTAEVIHSDQPDPDSTPGNGDPYEDDQDSVKITPRPHDANLCIQKWVDTPAPNKGDIVTFYIKVCNDPADFKDILVIDQLPEGIKFIDAYADKGSATFDSYTRKVSWTIPLLPFGETALLKVKVKVETKYHVENCAKIVASTPPDHPGDNKSCASITPGQSSGGGDAGIESDGNMATKLAQRLFHRRQDAQVKAALRAAPEPVRFTDGMKAATIGASKTMGAELSRYVPETGPMSTNAYAVTPADLLGLTNATSVFAADYIRPEGRRMAALFGATSPAGVLYDHAKATCDRLGGGRLEAVRLMEIEGRPFVLSRLIHADGSTDYAVSFVAYPTGAGYAIDSRFASSQYELPAGASEVLNFQLWSVAPEYTAELVSSVLAKLANDGPLAFLNTNDKAPTVPQVFVQDGSYGQGVLTLRIVNRSGASKAVVSGTAARTESDADQQRRVPFSHVVELPAPAEGEEVVTIAVNVGSVFDATFEFTHTESGSVDQVYYADGAWSYTVGQKAFVSSFGTLAHDAPVNPDGRYVVERVASMQGTVTDWASLFRYLRPNGEPVDLSAHRFVEFTARGTGRVEMLLEKASIKTWDQFGYAFDLTPAGKTYRVNFDQLTRNGGDYGFSGEDVTLAAFYLVGNGAHATAFDVTIENLSFGGASTVASEYEATLPNQISLGQNYPNPFNPATQIEFTLSESLPVRLAVYDVLGREVALLTDDLLQAGTHTVTFEAADLPSGTYLYRLATPQRTLAGKMILMK